MRFPPLGLDLNKDKVQIPDFGTVLWVAGWCPHCQHFHPLYEEAHHHLMDLKNKGQMKLPSSWGMLSLEGMPPSKVGDGVPCIVFVFNKKVLPLGLDNRFWTDKDQLLMILYALYGPLFQRWKENQKRRIQGQQLKDYADIIHELSYTGTSPENYEGYNQFLQSLPKYLDEA